MQIDESGLTMIRRGTAPMTQFQVLGERGSGTNYVRKLMQKNLLIHRVEALGWKHGFPHMVAIPGNLLVVCVVRHAWDWARSLYARPWHAHPQLQTLPFSGFIRSEWHSIVDRPTDFEELRPELNARGAPLQQDRHPITGRRFENIFALRNAKLAALRGMANRDCNLVFVRLEAFQQAPENMLNTVSETFDIERKGTEFSGVTRRLGNRFAPKVKNRPPPPEHPEKADAIFMRGALDIAQERAMGYVYD